MNQIIRDAKILIIDDNEENVLIVEQMLRKAGYHSVHGITDSRAALSTVAALRPDLLILDLLMPPPDGFAILDQLRLSATRDKLMAVLVLTGDLGAATKLKVLSMGAHEFLTKPVDKVDLLMRTRNLLDSRFARLEAKEEKARRLAAERSGESLDPQPDVVERIARIAACIDAERAQTGKRVAELSGYIVRELNWDEPAAGRLRSAARLFDIGMLALPESIRDCRDLRDAAGRGAIRQHTVLGQEMLGGSTCQSLEMAKDIASSHHERWDGTGYPLGTHGSGIPLAARIVAVALSYDAYLHEHRGRPALSPANALAEVQRQAGYAFDPDVVAALVQHFNKQAAPEASGFIEEVVL